MLGISNTQISGRSTRHSKGYVYRVAKGHPRADDAGRVFEHILIAETAIGKYLPDGAEIHHFDEITDHNQNSNLVICESRAYHFLLHARQRIVAAGGDPNLDKICAGCKELKPKESFHRESARFDGRHTRCKTCRRVIQC